MKSGNLKATVVSLLVLCTGGVSCALTATRPNQEMSNAEVALKAAKDLNADSLVPEVYRSAVDNYFKAKRDYRLKDFENARLHAIRTTRLAEQAEFEAYRLGGATPEAAGKAGAGMEGGTPDAESNFKEPTPPPQSPPDKDKPGGSTGPRQAMGPTGTTPVKQNRVTTVPDGIGPATGGLLPTTGGGPPSITNSTDAPPPDLTPNQGTSYGDMNQYSGKASKVGGALKEMEAEPLKDIYSGKDEIKDLGANGIKEKVGLDDVPLKELPEVKSKTMETLGAEPEKFEPAHKVPLVGPKLKIKVEPEEDSN